MKKLHLILLCLFCVFCWTSCEKEETTIEEPTPPEVDTLSTTPLDSDFRIGFYNVENLFDTMDDLSNEKDDEFLPDAPKKWTATRYQNKLKNIGIVMEGMDFPMVMGLAEVENRKVLEDLIQTDLLKNEGYDLIHFDSPDFRGIDVALIYQTSDFTVLESEAIEVVLPPSVSQFSTTRDILQVKGSYKGEEVYVFVNHWPSRSGGVAATTAKREYAASVLREAMDAILANEPNANMIAIGDFNDEPYNPSMLEVLQANTEKPTTLDNQLYNCTIPVLQAGDGSYFFDGNWQMIDQAVISGQLLDDVGQMKIVGYNVYNDEKVLFNHPTDGLRPDRTYSGNEYFGGFSDHLAIYLELKNL